MKVKLVTCQNYYSLLKSILSELEMNWVQNETLNCRCYFSNTKEKIENQNKINTLISKYDKIKLLLPLPCSGLNFDENNSHCSYQNMFNCFEMLLPEEQFNQLINEGNYMLTEAWLKRWEYYLLQEWGFDQKTAIEFFKESARSLALLQVKNNEVIEEELKKFAEYVQLEYKIIPIDLDYFRTYVLSIIEKESGT